MVESQNWIHIRMIHVNLAVLTVTVSQCMSPRLITNRHINTKIVYTRQSLAKFGHFMLLVCGG